MKGIIYRSASSLAHDTGPHPESAQRIVAIEAELERLDWCGYERCDSPAAGEQMLLRAHPLSYVDALRAACARSAPLDADTIVVPASLDAALHAAGGAASLAEALCDRTADVGASLHRPPGHHAEADRAMGFCLFNNVAIAARQSRATRRARPSPAAWRVGGYRVQESWPRIALRAAGS